MLAWDVCDSLRIQSDYAEEFTDLFDLPVDLPAGLAHWLSTPPTEMIDPVPLERESDPKYEVALLTLSKATKHSGEWPPEHLSAPLWGFVTKRVPQLAGDITRGIMHLIRWFHASTSMAEEVIDPVIMVPDVPINPDAVPGTDRLVKFVAALVALTDDVVVINVTTDRYPDGVYVQLCREDDGALTLEAVSSKFLQPSLTPEEISSLLSLGWESSEDEEVPNYTCYLEPKETSPGDIAEFLVETLQSVYGAKPSDLHQFEPNHLTRALLNGEHGPEFAVNPNHSDAQRACLHLGLRFPYDLNSR
jgi:hypothetical protein